MQTFVDLMRAESNLTQSVHKSRHIFSILNILSKTQMLDHVTPVPFLAEHIMVDNKNVSSVEYRKWM